jgi:hypothetical protein
LEAFDDSRRDVNYKTFARHLGREEIRALDQFFSVPLRRDYHVSFAVGKWKGKRAVCLFHSAYHHLWELPEKTRLTT